MLTTDQEVIERYRNAVAAKSRADWMFRTAVQYMDRCYRRHEAERCAREVEEAYAALYV